MIEYFQANLWQFWALIGVLCLILELTSGDFFIMCFSIGAFVTALVAAFGTSFTVQLIVFAIASLLCLLFVRPLALKYFQNNAPVDGEEFDNINNLSNAFREDIVVPSYPTDKILENANDSAEDCFLVKKRSL